MCAGKYEWPVQFLIRGEADKYHTAAQKARELAELMAGKDRTGIELPTVVSGEQWYVESCVVRSGPALIGVDQQRRPEFTLNLVLYVSLNGGLS
jgi:hypothetical protein